MAKLINEVWQINTTGKSGLDAKPDIAMGTTDNGKPAIRIGNNIVTGEGGGSGDSVWEKGTGENSVQTKGSLCEATGDNSVATGMNTHSGATASHSEGALTATRNDYDEETETGFDAAYSHVEGLNNATNNVAEHGEGKFGWSYYDENHDPSKCSIHYVGVGTNNQEEYRKDAEVIMANGDKYLLGVGGYDGKNIDGAQSVQTVINAMSAGSLYTVVKNASLIYMDSITSFEGEFDGSLLPEDFYTPGKYNIMIMIDGLEPSGDDDSVHLTYMANHFCCQIADGSLTAFCEDNLTSGITHSTSLFSREDGHISVSYIGKINEDIGIRQTGAKYNVYLQKLF